MTDTAKRCECFECQFRRVVVGEDATAPVMVDTGEALNALGTFAAEMLAHYPTKQAKRWADAVLEKRKEWQRHPRVRAQEPPAGHA